MKNLRSFHVDNDLYGKLLIPLVNVKLLDEMRVIIARKFESDFWDLDELISILRIKLDHVHITLYHIAFNSVAKCILG